MRQLHASMQGLLCACVWVCLNSMVYKVHRSGSFEVCISRHHPAGLSEALPSAASYPQPGCLSYGAQFVFSSSSKQ